MKQRKYIQDVELSQGTVHWSQATIPFGEQSIVPITCHKCGKTRYASRSNAYTTTRSNTGGCFLCFLKTQPHGPGWKGGKQFTKEGYILLHKCILSQSEQKYVTRKDDCIAEHRLVIMRKLGRQLRLDESVHHLNGVKDDNSIENLCLLTRKSHAKTHASLQKALKVEIFRLQELLKKHGIAF